jgi:hypothetical protein
MDYHGGESMIPNTFELPTDPDARVAQWFLDRLAPKGTVFTFLTLWAKDAHGVPEPALPPPPDGKELIGTLDQHMEELARRNKQGWEVYVTVNRSHGGRTKEAMVWYSAFWREVDSNKMDRDPPSVPLASHMTVRTSWAPGFAPNFHEYWLLKHGNNWPLFDRVMAVMIEKYGCDKSGGGRNRVLRLPGFYHCKDRENPYAVHVFADKPELPLYTLEDVAAQFGCLEEQEQAREGGTKKTATFNTEYGLAALDNELKIIRAMQGITTGRNNQFNTSAYNMGQLVGGGELTEDHAITELLLAALQVKPEEETETRKTLASGMTAGKKKPRSAPGGTAGDGGTDHSGGDAGYGEPRRADMGGDGQDFEYDTKPWPVLNRKALHGIAGDFVELATRESEADPAAVLITFLVRFGAECGPAPYMNVGDTKHRARMAAVVVGASSKSRKGTSGKPVNLLFGDGLYRGWEGDGPVISARVSPGPFSSGEGIIHAIRDKQERWDEKDQAYKVIDPGIADKRLFVLDEEFGGVMASTKREGNILSMIIRQAWDNGTFDPLTKTTKISATGGHLCWVSHVTLEELRSRLDDQEGFNGFANRILWVCARRSKKVAFPIPMPNHELAAIQDKLAGVIKAAGRAVEVSVAPVARKDWIEKHYEDLSEERPGLVGCVTNRGEAQVLRLAMLYALLDGVPVISADHLVAALALWDYCRQSAEYIFHGKQSDKVVQRILAAIKEGPKTSTELHRMFNNHVPRERMETALAGLISSGKIVAEHVDGGRGRRVKVYKLRGIQGENREFSENKEAEAESDPLNSPNSPNSHPNTSEEQGPRPSTTTPGNEEMSF